MSPKAATVTRVNWNTRANGSCIELRYADGTLARFLHLSEARVKKGQHVRPGQTIALSGNSGNSTAPHLHYELSKGKTYVDPLAYHGTVRRRLEEAAMPDFNREMARLDGLLGESFASR
jgi:murein DD-endopeptidase MepM/ murein hydrolase activator NlpD